MHVFSGEDDGIEFEEYCNHLISGLEYNLIEHTLVETFTSPKTKDLIKKGTDGGRSQGQKRDQAYFEEDGLQVMQGLQECPRDDQDLEGRVHAGQQAVQPQGLEERVQCM